MRAAALVCAALLLTQRQLAEAARPIADSATPTLAAESTRVFLPLVIYPPTPPRLTLGPITASSQWELLLTWGADPLASAYVLAEAHDAAFTQPVTDSTFVRGAVGFLADAGLANFEARFDNYTLYDGSCQPGAAFP